MKKSWGVSLAIALAVSTMIVHAGAGLGYDPNLDEKAREFERTNTLRRVELAASQ